MLIAATSQAIGIPAHHINAIAVPAFKEQKIGMASIIAEDSVLVKQNCVCLFSSHTVSVYLFT